jgi:hypothetical protein
LCRLSSCASLLFRSCPSKRVQIIIELKIARRRSLSHVADDPDLDSPLDRTRLFEAPPQKGTFEQTFFFSSSLAFAFGAQHAGEYLRDTDLMIRAWRAAGDTQADATGASAGR